MPDVIIADTSVLIIISKIEALELLYRMYGEVFITPEVADEYGEPIPSWISLKSPKDAKYVSLLQTQVDAGEASAIALACETSDVLLLLDDLKARKLAAKLGFRISGTLGVVGKARDRGFIASVGPYIEKLQDTDFHIASQLLDVFLKEFNR